MPPITTSNIISTPDIQGTISNCTTNATIINNVNRTNPFIQKDMAYMTNSCTGQTEIINSWEFSPLTVGIANWIELIFGLFLSLIIAIVVKKLFIKK